MCEEAPLSIYKLCQILPPAGKRHQLIKIEIKLNHRNIFDREPIIMRIIMC